MVMSTSDIALFTRSRSTLSEMGAVLGMRVLAEVEPLGAKYRPIWRVFSANCRSEHELQQFVPSCRAAPYVPPAFGHEQYSPTLASSVHFSTPMHAAHPVVLPRTRFLYGCYLAFAGLALALGALACGAGSVNLALRGVGALAMALLLRSRLASDGRLAACAEEDDAPVCRTVGPETADESIIARCAAMEKLRGTPGFDPWEYGVLRAAAEASRHPKPDRRQGKRS